LALFRGLEQAISVLIVQKVQDFHGTYVVNREQCHIMKAIVPVPLDHVVDETAEEVNTKRIVAPKTLRGVVYTEDNNVNHGLSSKVTSLQEEISRLKGVKGRPVKKEKIRRFLV
jgi:hypothetical protein